MHAHLTRALTELSGKFHPADVDKLESLITDTMSGKNRRFHTLDHVFQVCRGGDGIAVLAALFHDVVYLNIDGGVSKEIGQILAEYVDLSVLKAKVQVSLHEDLPQEVEPLLALFGVKKGQQISQLSGLNEFLSALVAHHSLRKILPPSQWIQVVACIELTIPFRKKNSSGQTAAAALFTKLQYTDEKYALNLGKKGCEAAIERAVEVANRDIGNFASENSTQFLDSTWQLIAENYPAIHGGKNSAPNAYEGALEQMEKFFDQVVPENIFQSFNGKPSSTELTKLQNRAAENIALAKTYFKKRLAG